MPEAILVLTHTDEAGSSLTKSSLETVTAGKTLADRLETPLVIGILATDSNAAAKSLPGLNARILGVSGEAFEKPQYAADVAACEALCNAAQATVILAPQSSRMARVAAGLAHRISGSIDTHITSIQGDEAIEVTRWLYRQRIEATITRSVRPWILLIEGGVCAAYEGHEGEGELEQVAVELPELRTNVIGTRAPAHSGQTIRPDAKMLFVAGAGWTKKQADGQVHAGEAGELILSFLQKTSASLGSSKSLVDQGGDGQPVLPFLSHMNQVGQTGATPRHPKGLATCCHGEEPHVVGWRFITERRAISLDPNCGWARGKADVVYIADAFKVIAKVNELLALKA
ncbi:MAG: electron transfer flavoprotein subunit alpha [Acidobacteria bacterium]|nr:electron transfer flavoprotein subunit alpha [Acidobacteriota bacterium]